MDYNRYYEKLVNKNQARQNDFLNNHVFTHRDGKYHTDPLPLSTGFSLNFVISSDRSRAFGNDNGLIIELYITNKNYFQSHFNQLLKYKNEIENELNTTDIVWQSSEETQSGNVCRVFSKKTVDIEDENKWDEYIDWQINTMIKFMNVFPKYIDRINDIGVVKMNEDDFIQWSKITPNLQGNIFSDNKINDMVNQLKIIIPNKLNELDNVTSNGNLFNETNMIVLDGLKRRFSKNSASDLYQWDWDRNGHGFGSSALGRYVKFLKARNTTLETIEKDESNLNDSHIKNIILYGSPGVGKTHNTNKLISLIESGIPEKEIFQTIKNNEQNNGVDIRDIKDRVKFITFHQSFGYEDFIEGFRPNEEGTIQLDDGVFKQICHDAQKNLDDSLKAETAIGEEKKFEILFELFKDYIQDDIDVNQKFAINDTAYITNIEENAFRYQGDNWGHTQRMKFDDIKLLYSENISERKDIKSVDGVSGLAIQHATYFSYFMKQLLVFENKQDIHVDTVEKVEQQNYYLVIDEINRGNISKIFGELITLIEEDKRDTLEVTLPYSKKPFKIPSNLYIIGTMNSTDKSIALIDIALRRRFTFLKMEPKSILVKYEKAKKIMEQLNNKLIELNRADYVIGHSYFMEIRNDDDLDFVLEYKIKPLLEEYFYGDEQGYKNIISIIDSVDDATVEMNSNA